MADRPLVSMVLIARDERRNIEPCFSSWWPHVDEVVLVDTGSNDGTVEAARAFARKRKEPDKLTVGRFKWTDDFAAARNHAHSLVTGQWVTWADLDDSIVGAERLRNLAASAPAETTAFMADYWYATDEHGNCICTLKRERLVRSDRVQWLGRVHEAMSMERQTRVQFVPADQLLWKHRKKPGDTPNDRNLQILEKWAEDEPDNGRVIQYLGTERAGQGKHEQAVDAYHHYLGLDGEPAEHRAQVWRKLACSLIALDRPSDAFDAGIGGLKTMPAWPDCYLTLAQASYLRGDLDNAVEWARDVIRRGMPSTLLIVNPLDYTVEPRVVLAVSLAAQNKLDEACDMAEQALSVAPEHPLLAPNYRQWLVTRKRQKTADTWLASAQMLAAHDEQAKALALLEQTVPYFAQDHPQIVAARSELRERLRLVEDQDEYEEHYRTGGSKPEDMIPDGRVTSLCEALPRAQFLARQIEEMLEAA